MAKNHRFTSKIPPFPPYLQNLPQIYVQNTPFPPLFAEIAPKMTILRPKHPLSPLICRLSRDFTSKTPPSPPYLQEICEFYVQNTPIRPLI